MANAKGSTNVRNTIQTGKNSVLPPRIPFPNVNQPYADYGLNSAMGSKVISKPRDGNIYHHRTPSESLIEEQPCWLDELLNEPESPLRKGHRRSSSDSFAYTDASSASSLDYAPMAYDENKFKPVISSLWGSQNFDHTRDDHQGHVYATPYCYGKPKNRAWELPLNSVTHPNSLSQSRDNGISQSARSSAALKEAEPVPSTAAIKEQTHDPKTSSEKKDTSHAKTSPENDTKRAKQKFAQRSRVRKLQYIAELEKNVQALQAEGSEFSAEVEFLNQQNLILSMENKALKQRLESLAQEKLIKYLEHEVLEREIGRLRGLYQQQQQQQHQQQQARQGQSSTGHRRGNSKDLDSQFALLNLNHKEADSGAEPVTGSLPM